MQIASEKVDISKAIEKASKAVRQLGSLLFEMEVLRSFLETRSDLRYFDTRVAPAKLVAHKAIQKLQGRLNCDL